MQCPLTFVSSINHQNLPIILLHHTEWLLPPIVNDFLKIQNHDLSLYLHSPNPPKLALWFLPEMAYRFLGLYKFGYSSRPKSSAVSSDEFPSDLGIPISVPPLVTSVNFTLAVSLMPCALLGVMGV